MQGNDKVYGCWNRQVGKELKTRERAKILVSLDRIFFLKFLVLNGDLLHLCKNMLTIRISMKLFLKGYGCRKNLPKRVFIIGFLCTILPKFIYFEQIVRSMELIKKLPHIFST